MKRTYLLLKPYVLKKLTAYIGLFLLMFLDIAIILAYAWFMGNLTDAAVHSEFDRLKMLLFIGAALAIVSISSNFADTYLETIAVHAVKKDLSINLYKHVLLLPESARLHLHLGQLLSHFTNEIHNVDAIIDRGLISLVRLPLISIAAFIFLVQISWKLSLFSLLIVPVAMLGGVLFGWLLRNNSRAIYQLISSIHQSLNDLRTCVWR